MKEFIDFFIEWSTKDTTFSYFVGVIVGYLLHAWHKRS